MDNSMVHKCSWLEQGSLGSQVPGAEHYLVHVRCSVLGKGKNVFYLGTFHFNKPWKYLHWSSKKGYFSNFRSNAIWQLPFYNTAFLTVSSALATTLLIYATTVVVLSLANRRVWNIDIRTFLLFPLQKQSIPLHRLKEKNNPNRDPWLILIIFSHRHETII